MDAATYFKSTVEPMVQPDPYSGTHYMSIQADPTGDGDRMGAIVSDLCGLAPFAADANEFQALTNILSRFRGLNSSEVRTRWSELTERCTSDPEFGAAINSEIPSEDK